MGSFSHSRRVAACIAAASIAGVAGSPLTCTADASAHATNSAKPTKKLSKKARRKIERELRAQMRRNPSSVFTKTFLKKADLVDFKTPLTVRLDTLDGNGGVLPSDDQLEVTYDDSVISWPLSGATLPAVQTTYLSGVFTMEAEYGGDASGYGEPGAMETFQGNQIAMQADPFTISEFDPACGSGPQITADPAHQIAVTSAGGRYGLMNMFSQTFRGSLSLRMTFASQVQDSCGGTTSLTPTIDNSSAPPMPVSMNGKFYVSPAITADGQMRLGKIVIDDSVSPQTSTFAYVRSCTDSTPTCDPQQFPARLKVKKLTADVLLGDIRS